MYSKLAANFDWLQRVARSCTTREHIATFKKLQELHDKLFHHHYPRDPNLHIMYSKNTGILEGIIMSKEENMEYEANPTRGLY